MTFYWSEALRYKTEGRVFDSHYLENIPQITNSKDWRLLVNSGRMFTDLRHWATRRKVAGSIPVTWKMLYRSIILRIDVY